MKARFSFSRILISLITACFISNLWGQAPASTAKLNEDQRLFEQWTDRQFRGFFDDRSFPDLSDDERRNMELKLLDTLKGPHSREYYQAIGTLAALKSKKAVAPLLAIAIDRAEKNCRDRWMAIRSLGLIGDRTVVPELIHLVYHGNINTRWSAQLSLVRLTKQNFGKDWMAWGNWWNETKGNPPFNPEFVIWYRDTQWSDPEKIETTLAENDQKYFDKLK